VEEINMAQNYLLPQSPFEFNPKFGKINLSNRFINLTTLPLYINLFFSGLLIALGLRIVLALFLFNGTLYDLVSVITYAFVEPFRALFDSGNEMFQFPAIVAFVVYYFTYQLARRATKVISARQPSTD
jgi:hypothetical protein